MTGTYLLQFDGKATVTTGFNLGKFSAGGTSYGASLPAGAGYNPATNMTTATMQIGQSDLASILYLTFKNTQRTATSPLDSGVTNVSLMRPTSPGASTYDPPGTLFDPNVEAAFADYTTERWLTANGNTTEVNWSDRALPGYATADYSDGKAVWEYLVMLANETGKDLYITIPVNASDQYVTNLANLLRYGSDGVNPYTSPQANPVYPGLNPNLHVYVEWSNEVWNSSFAQSSAAATASLQAVQSGSANGKIINYDGNAPDGDFRRWVALRTVEASNIFRSVFGGAAMNNTVRFVLEYQYNNWQNTASTELEFIDDYFDNGDGQNHVSTPHPVDYYLWGAGAAAYYNAGNPTGAQDEIVFTNAGFESSTTAIAPGVAQVDPAGASWDFHRQRRHRERPNSGFGCVKASPGQADRVDRRRFGLRVPIHRGQPGHRRLRPRPLGGPGRFAVSTWSRSSRSARTRWSPRRTSTPPELRQDSMPTPCSRARRCSRLTRPTSSSAKKMVRTRSTTRGRRSLRRPGSRSTRR